jgi:hypothetical protein
MGERGFLIAATIFRIVLPVAFFAYLLWLALH